MRREAKRPLLIGRVIVVFLSIFTKSQESSPFETMNSAHLSMCKKDGRPSVQKRWRTMAFSRVSTGDSVSDVGSLWSSIKEIEAPYVFDWEYTIAMDTMQGNWASSRGERKVSLVFSSCGRNLRYILELRRRCPFETGVCSVKSGNLSRYEGQLRNVN